MAAKGTRLPNEIGPSNIDAEAVMFIANHTSNQVPSVSSFAQAPIDNHKSHPRRVGLMIHQFESLIGKKLY
jgi:hypothetical protein